MPLSKVKNRERMRQIRLHKRHLSPYQSKPVQPRPIEADRYEANDRALQGLPRGVKEILYLDADGNPVYNE